MTPEHQWPDHTSHFREPWRPSDQYRDDAGGAILRESFVGYVDALGTADELKTFDQVKLREQLDVLAETRWFLGDKGGNDLPEGLLSFTDNIVVGTPRSPDMDDGGLALQVQTVSAYQHRMTLRRRFVRGGLTLGDFYMDSRLATGPALLEAVTLEHEVATFPRIILSDSCAGLAMENGPWNAGDLIQAWNNLLLVDADGRVFVHYLANAIDAGPNGDQAWHESVLTDHRAATLEGLATAAGNQRIREKYVWVANYHNFVCRELSHQDLLIDDVLSVMEHRFPRQFRSFA
ncbi:MAG TPA: hypothetical protein VNA87_02660 [Actinomycetota bacterium]|nr:hypothetical protein [Actinomycetota bacterium]